MGEAFCPSLELPHLRLGGQGAEKRPSPGGRGGQVAAAGAGAALPGRGRLGWAGLGAAARCPSPGPALPGGAVPRALCPQLPTRRGVSSSGLPTAAPELCRERSRGGLLPSRGPKGRTVRGPLSLGNGGHGGAARGRAPAVGLPPRAARGRPRRSRGGSRGSRAGGLGGRRGERGGRRARRGRREGRGEGAWRAPLGTGPPPSAAFGSDLGTAQKPGVVPGVKAGERCAWRCPCELPHTQAAAAPPFKKGSSAGGWGPGGRPLPPRAGQMFPFKGPVNRSSGVCPGWEHSPGKSCCSPAS